MNDGIRGDWCCGGVVVILALAAGLSCSSSVEGEIDWASVSGGIHELGSREAPHNPPHTRAVADFDLSRHEVTNAEFCRYLNQDEVTPGWGKHPQIVRIRDIWRPRLGQSKRPVAWVTPREAADFCAWRSRVEGRMVRLPEPDEWEVAARSGREDVRYPWGWGDPSGQAAFGLRASKPVGRYPPNELGLYDLAGNVAEWCIEAGQTNGWFQARGGSWADRDPVALRVYRTALLPADYRDADVGFRVVREKIPQHPPR